MCCVLRIGYFLLRGSEVWNLHILEIALWLGVYVSFMEAFLRYFQRLKYFIFHSWRLSPEKLKCLFSNSASSSLSQDIEIFSKLSVVTLNPDICIYLCDMVCSIHIFSRKVSPCGLRFLICRKLFLLFGIFVLALNISAYLSTALLHSHFLMKCK